MVSGRSVSSGSVVYASRANAANELPVVFRGVHRYLVRRDPYAFHLRIGLEEALSEERDVRLERGAGEVARRRVDEVFHRVGGHDLTVVPFGVGGREALAEDVDRH